MGVRIPSGALSDQRFHDPFVHALNSAGSTYAAADAANASPLQSVQQELLGAINAPTEVLTGRPLIGNGANGYTNAQGVGTPGSARCQRTRRGTCRRTLPTKPTSGTWIAIGPTDLSQVVITPLFILASFLK